MSSTNIRDKERKMILLADLLMFFSGLSLLELHKILSVFNHLAVSMVCCFSIRLNWVFLPLCHHIVGLWFPSDLLLCAHVAFFHYSACQWQHEHFNSCAPKKTCGCVLYYWCWQTKLSVGKHRLAVNIF